VVRPTLIVVGLIVLSAAGCGGGSRSTIHPVGTSTSKIDDPVLDSFKTSCEGAQKLSGFQDATKAKICACLGGVFEKTMPHKEFVALTGRLRLESLETHPEQDPIFAEESPQACRYLISAAELP